jgi:adenylate cyclase
VRGYRNYATSVNGQPSLGLAAVRAAGIEPKLPVDRPTAVRYYGPHRDASGKPTFPTYMASRVLFAEAKGNEQEWGVAPEMFKDKIVLVGLLAEGLGDLKLTPMGPGYPGVEFHATVITNLIRGDEVKSFSRGFVSLVSLFAATVAAIAAIALRGTVLKLLGGAVVAPLVILLAWLLFRAESIRFLAPTMPLLATLLATTAGVGWSYFGEARRARFLLKALESCVSPAVAAELERDPARLTVGGRQLEMTVMFTDLAGFTALTEQLKERIEPALNYYLGEMTDQILARDGTVDKYIGDAIMSFWNAPLDQPEHARFACEAALGLARRERDIRPQLEALGMRDTITRIGINTGTMFVGFTGSRRKLNYTVIGDSVNLAARLEPANKLYQTQILVAERTVVRCAEHFLFRLVDLLQVKGKTEPMRVYELLGEASMRNTAAGDLARRFEEAFDLHCQRRWDDAQAILLELSRRFADDGPVATLRARIEEYRRHPPAPDWNGAYVATSK